MSTPTVPEGRPLRVAVIGAGPSGFYIAQALLRTEAGRVEIDLFDRLPAPYGLVRYGVAPDHQKIKSVTRVYEKIALEDAVRFFGNVEIGSDLSTEELLAHYDQVAFCTGAQTDRRLGIPGEDLAGSHPATEFVAWYNGHPDFRDCTFDLSGERALVVGVGNVAIDVARILARTPEELARTDIADYALEALRESRIREVILLGRRGPAQAAFTNSELEEMGELEGADAVTLPEEAELDPVSREHLEANPDRQVQMKVELLQKYAEPLASPKPRRVVFRFLMSPVELFDDGTGAVRRVRLVRNEPYLKDDGSVRSRPTEQFEEQDVQIVFRSVGYRGVPLPGVPFREDWGTIPHTEGRVLTKPGGTPVPGMYVAGWIKRGPSGVIGTNRPDAQETVKAMLEDVGKGLRLGTEPPARDAVVALLEQRGVRYVSFEDWKRLDALEVERGAKLGRPRVKLVTPDEMLQALQA